MKTEIYKSKHLKTNITKLTELYGMHSHTAAKVDDLLTNHLPRGYAKKIVGIALKHDIIVSDTTVRQVKTLSLSNIEILNYLTALATEPKAYAEAQHEKLERSVLKN